MPARRRAAAVLSRRGLQGSDPQGRSRLATTGMGLRTLISGCTARASPCCGNSPRWPSLRAGRGWVGAALGRLDAPPARAGPVPAAPAARIELAARRPASPVGERVMVGAMPPHGDQPAVGHVVAYAGAPRYRARARCGRSSRPASAQSRTLPRTAMPHTATASHPARTAPPRQLLRHPGAIDELVEAIPRHAPLDDELGGWAVAARSATAANRRGEGGAVREVSVAMRLPLRPVADVVLADHAVWAGHAHQRAQITNGRSSHSVQS